MSSTVPVFSKNINGSTELTLVAKLRPGFVPLPDPMSYGTRLDQLLTELFATRKDIIEQGPAFLGPLERLRTISFVRWVLLDGGKRLLLAVTFDRPWEPYIRRIVEQAGPLLDVIFSHCEGYEGHSCKEGYGPFAEWVRARQQECEFFFAAFPGQTVDDQHIAAKLRANLERFIAGDPTNPPDPAPGAPAPTLAALPLDSQLSSLNVAPPGVPEYAAFFRGAIGLYRLRSLFPENPVPDKNYSDRSIFDRACGTILSAFSNEPPISVRVSLPAFLPALAAQYDGLLAWYEDLFKVPAAPVVNDTASVADAQQGILRGHVDANNQQMTHGCAVLLQFGDNTPLFLDNIRKKCAAAEDVRYNVAFTFRGLAQLGLSAEELSMFPPEFQQGMAARAGLLGDVGSNHPMTWSLPRVNVQNTSQLELQLTDVDVVVLLQTVAPPAAGDHEWSPQHPLAQYVEMLQIWGARPLHVQPLRREAIKGVNYFREHFGFLDGFGQPAVVARTPNTNEVTNGEVLLGHPNDNGEVFGDKNPLLNNGSFLVLRKLSQNVEAFNGVLNQVASADRAALASKMVGRDPNGVTLTDPTLANSNTTFDYTNDTFGAGCPLQSHARLANPRTPDVQSVFGRRMRVPRIVRRGFSYGARYVAGAKVDERGLLFMAFNASIAQQYEVIQRWLNGANGTGLDSSQRDPLTGAVSNTGGHTFRYRDGNKVVTVPLPPKPLATLKWGMYTFAPSLKGIEVLRNIAKRAQEQAEKECPCPLSSDEQAGLGRGQKILAELMQSHRPEDWRAVLEEQGARTASFEALSAIRAIHRVLHTPIGVVVTGAEEALTVLTNEETYSVREYYRRMVSSSMPMHLGMDAQPLNQSVCPMRGVNGVPADAQYLADIANGKVNYERESISNEYIDQITRVEGFLAAYEITSALLTQSIGVQVSAGKAIEKLVEDAGGQVPPPTPKLRVPVDLNLLCQATISKLSAQWFGLPDGASMKLVGEPTDATDQFAHCPVDFTTFSLFVFRPDPDSATEALAAARGAAVTAAANAVVNQQVASGDYTHVFLQHLNNVATSKGLSGVPAQQLVVRSLVGTVDGFVAACYGSFLSVIEQWMEDGELFRTQQAFQTELSQAFIQALEAKKNSPTCPEEIADARPFVAKVVEALTIFPKPPWVHRVATEDTVLGGVHIKRGQRVSVHLGQAAIEQPGNPALLFGGPYDIAGKSRAADHRTPLHACPAREMALGVVLGMLVAVLSRNNLRMEERFALSFEAVVA